jgi:hypothetical protein
VSSFHRVLGHVDGAAVVLPGIFTYDEALVRQAALEVARKRGDKIVKLGPKNGHPAIVSGVPVRALWFIVRSVNDPQAQYAPELRLVVIRGRGTGDIRQLLVRRFKGQYMGDHGGHIRRVRDGKPYGPSVSHGWWGMLRFCAPGEIVQIQQARTSSYHLIPSDEMPCDDCGRLGDNHNTEVEH